MAKVTRRKKHTPKKVKTAGRKPSTGTGRAMMVRVHQPLLDEIDQWIGESGMSRPEAIRQLARHALNPNRTDTANE